MKHEGKIAIIGMGSESVFGAAMGKLLMNMGDDVQIVTAEQVKDIFSPEPTFKITAPPLAYLEPGYIPPTKKSVHHNSKQRPAKRKKKGKKTHRK